MRVYTAFAGLSRNKARVVHGILSGVWVCLSIAGLGIIEQVKQETGKPRYHSYPLSSPCKQVHHTSLTPVLRVCVCGGRCVVSCRVQSAREVGPGGHVLFADTGRRGYAQAVRPLQEQPGTRVVRSCLLSFRCLRLDQIAHGHVVRHINHHRREQRFLRWHGRLGTLVYASALTAFLTGVMQKFESSTQFPRDPPANPIVLMAHT